MARKTLLTEGELQRFMKLANMEPVGKERIQEMGGYGSMPGARDEEEAMGDELSDMDAEDDREKDEIGDLEADLDADDMEMADEPGMDAALEAKFAEFMQQVASVAQEVLGIDVDVEEAGAADMGDDMMDMDMGDEEVEVDMVAGEEDMSPEGGEIEMAGMMDEEPVMEKQGADDREDEHLGMEDGPESEHSQSEKDRRKEMRGARRAAGEKGDPVPTQESLSEEDDIVAEVAKRVAARLQQETTQAEVIDQLAERIMKRLTK